MDSFYICYSNVLFCFVFKKTVFELHAAVDRASLLSASMQSGRKLLWIGQFPASPRTLGQLLGTLGSYESCCDCGSVEGRV